MCGLYGANGKFNVTNGSSGPNRLYRTSGQREWATNWRFSYEQSKKCVRHAMEVNKLTAGGDMQIPGNRLKEKTLRQAKRRIGTAPGR